MKTKLCLFLLYFFAVFILAWGQASDFTWPNWLTSDTWEKWSKEAKFGYIAGFLHGEIIGALSFNSVIEESKLFDKNKIQKVWKKNADDSTFFKSMKVTFGQMIDGIDGFYRDYANKDIPVYKLLPLVCKRVKGEISQESIEKELQKLRAELHEKKD